MIIASLNHKSEEGAYAAIDKLDRSLMIAKMQSIIPDIIIAPDYTLNTSESFKQNRPNTTTERHKVLKEIKALTRDHSQTLFLPGTMFWYDKSKIRPQTDKSYVAAPLYSTGRLLREFFKERNNGEAERTEKYATSIGRKAEYKNGDNSQNFFYYKGAIIAVEICGDHGNQKTDIADLELILALDNKGGFYLTSANDNWTRYALLSNGYDGHSTMQHYDHKKHESISIKENTIRYMDFFDIPIGEKHV